MSSIPDVEPGQFRLEVRLYGPEVERDEGYGPRKRREQLVALDLPTTWMAWSYINHILAEYTKPAYIITGPDK